jgi:hypothetical protein
MVATSTAAGQDLPADCATAQGVPDMGLDRSMAADVPVSASARTGP